MGWLYRLQGLVVELSIQWRKLQSVVASISVVGCAWSLDLWRYGVPNGNSSLQSVEEDIDGENTTASNSRWEIC